MKVFYWAPFFTEIATISAVINSAKSLLKYSKSNKYSVSIINAIGEWDEYQTTINKNINFKKLLKKNYVKKIPKSGFLKSRFSYLFIFTISFFKLLKLINSEKPDFLIIHLITSLPIFSSIFFNKRSSRKNIIYIFRTNIFLGQNKIFSHFFENKMCIFVFGKKCFGQKIYLALFCRKTKYILFFGKKFVSDQKYF